MITNTLKSNKTLKNQAESVDFSAILLVYKSKEGYWKGFAHPYDVTVDGNTKNQTLKKLKESVDAYEDELKKFNFASHLVNKPQSDLEDREMFAQVVTNAIIQKGTIDADNYHAETHQIRS